MIYFCCRSDNASPTNPILLPTERPFVLYRHGGDCQKVVNMTVVEDYILWNDEFSFNKDDTHGSFPDDDGGKRKHKLHYCHYTPKWYALKILLYRWTKTWRVLRYIIVLHCIIAAESDKNLVSLILVSCVQKLYFQAKLMKFVYKIYMKEFAFQCITGKWFVHYILSMILLLWQSTN